MREGQNGTAMCHKWHSIRCKTKKAIILRGGGLEDYTEDGELHTVGKKGPWPNRRKRERRRNEDDVEKMVMSKC
jgi:hypothetical protein